MTDGGDDRPFRRFLVRALFALNASTLAGLTAWLYFNRDASDHAAPFLNSLHWWTLEWGRYVPAIVNKAESIASQGAALVGSLVAFFTLLLSAIAAYASRNRERRMFPTFGLLLAVGWIWLGMNWDVIRLRGQSAELLEYANTISDFAIDLDSRWPEREGEIEGFGAFLAYPYGTPRTLIMLGETHIPGTPLQVAAVERTPDQAVRFQLTGDAPDVWFEWRLDGRSPEKFRGGLDQIHTPITRYEMASDLFLVRYQVTSGSQ